MVCSSLEARKKIDFLSKRAVFFIMIIILPK